MSVLTYPGFAPSRPGSDGSCLLISAEDFRDTTVGDPQLPGDDTRSDTVMSHFHYLVPDMIWQRPAVYKNSSELVHSSLT